MRMNIKLLVLALFCLITPLYGCNHLSAVVSPPIKNAVPEDPVIGKPDSTPVVDNITTEEPAKQAPTEDNGINNQEMPNSVNVSQRNDRITKKGDTDRPVVYLTFDGGQPTEPVERFLDILKENDVKGTFFITGNYFQRENLRQAILRMVEEGHTVGNHTNTHPRLPDLTREGVIEEILLVNQNYNELTKKEMLYLRPPYGSYSDQSLDITSELGMKTVLWSMDYRDWQKLKGGPDEAHQHVMSNLHNGAIILMHLNSDDTLAALDRIIKDLKARGYQIEPL